MTFDERMRKEFTGLIRSARRISADFGREVEAALRTGKEVTLTPEEAHRIVSRALELVKSARVTSDGAVEFARDLDDLAREIVRVDPGAARAGRRVVLMDRDGVVVNPLQPTRVFHGRKIPMDEGIVRTRDISLWDENVRLEVHLQQFRKLNGRAPTDEELIGLMLSQMNLPGTKKNEFKIRELADSIAVNGVRVPPILSHDGRLLDGNRRIAACHFILKSEDYDAEAKARAEYLYVWMLTAHATPDDESAVVVSLNFEEDRKEPWPEYVKATKIYEEWRGLLALEARDPSPRRLGELRRQLARKFAMGEDTNAVVRLVRMMDWAVDFEEHLTKNRSKDQFEARHVASKYFQYFDELSKGAKPGGVAYALGQDEELKRLVFDLLAQGKFKNWTVIRKLKYIPDSPVAVEDLKRLRDQTSTNEEDLEEIGTKVDDLLTLLQGARPEIKRLGANEQVARFVRFLKEIPVGQFSEVLTDESLFSLRDALALVQPEAEFVLRKRGKLP